MAEGADTIQEVAELQFRVGDQLLDRLMADGIVLMHKAKQVRICISLDPDTKKRITVKPLPKPEKTGSTKTVKKRKGKSR